MTSLAGLAFEDVAYAVCSAFSRAGILAVLVGGGAATYYAPLAYQTRDLDFVLHLELFGAPSVAILQNLGFAATRTPGTYANPETPFTLEILNGPLAVGERTLTTWETYRKCELVLNVISVQDCIRDRLAHAIHFKDLSALQQAAEVAKLHAFDKEELRAWCEAEGGLQTYEVFVRFLDA